MSEQIYNYLTNKIMEYFQNNPIKSGDKFYIQFEKEKEVKELYNSLKRVQNAENFRYIDPEHKEEYRSYVLAVQGGKLLVSATIDGIHPDYLTLLRNKVGVESEFMNMGILFIHNSTLDSILGGTGSFHKEGMPFHYKSIEKDIMVQIEQSCFNLLDKIVLKTTLENKREVYMDENVSVFAYKDILNVMNTTGIERKQYRNFDLFPDTEAEGKSEKEIRERLEINRKSFINVADAHNFGLLESKLDKYFDERGVERLKKDDWEEVDFSQVKKYIDGKKEKEVIDYIKCEGTSFDRAQGETKAKVRIRNIIAFQNADGSNISLSFSFTDFLQKEDLPKIEDKSIAFSTSGKKLNVEISWNEKQSKFYFVKYKHKNKVQFSFNIVVLSCNPCYLRNIKSKFSIIKGKKNVYPDHILINTDDTELFFQSNTEETMNVELVDMNQHIVLKEQSLKLNVSDDYNYAEDSELVQFDLEVEECTIPFAILGTRQKTSVIESLKLWKQKRDKKEDFVIIGQNKLQQGTNEYCTREEFRKILELEKVYIESGCLAVREEMDRLHSMDLQVSDEIQNAFSAIVEYFKTRNLLPSLAYLNDDLRELYQNYIDVYLSEVKAIGENEYLAKEQKDLFYIGMVVRNVDDKEIMLSPLHPLNVAYQLHIADVDTSGITNDEKDILLKLQSRNLLPFITMNPVSEKDNIYVPVQQNVFAEWNTYIDVELPRYKGTKEYVSKLVCEKIHEFVEHFSYLFDIGVNAPIRLNLINTGDSKEILQGVLKYYLKEFREKNSRLVHPMEIVIYNREQLLTAFEEFASIDNWQELKEVFNLDLTVEDMKEEDVIDLYHEKVQFYTKSCDEAISYAHITFMEMLEENKITVANMYDIPTGITMNGMTSSVPSKLIGEMYRTGFGLKYANTNSQLVQLAARLNAMNVALNGNEFHDNSCCTYTISKQSRIRLDEIYDASHWVTFINPMVDLNFFKNDTNNSDLLIIHYSDQYNTTSSGYDAITVTRRSAQYVHVIEQYLKKFSVCNLSEKSAMIINMFNAVNGDWLLRLLSSKSHYPKEKISILSAIKLAIARFEQEGVIWVPISLEEILRISKGVGLKQSSGLFSVKNLGFENNFSTSDDLLLVGVKKEDDMVKVTFYPIEVKIGEVPKDYLEKGIKQAKATSDLFRDTLVDGKKEDELRLELYRNFFMQLTVTSAEKLLLYQIGDGLQGWEQVVESDLRRKLLNGEFEVVDSFNTDMKVAAVFSFKKNGRNQEFYHDNVLVIEKTEVDGIDYISETISAIGRMQWNALQIVTDLEEYKKDTNIVQENVKEEKADNEIIVSQEIEVEEVESDKVHKVEKEAPIEKIEDAYEWTAATLRKEESHSVETEEEIRKNNYMKVLFGNKLGSQEAVNWYPNDTRKMTHTNTGIIGTMGTGKTQFTKSLITQLYHESKYNVDGKEIGILIFDYKGDYNESKKDFVEATNAKVYSLCDLPFNPLSLFITDNPKPMLPMHTASSLTDTLGKAFNLGIKQKTTLRNLIVEAYEQKGIDKKDSSTWTNEPPTLNDVYELYVNRQDLKEDSLFAAFSNLIDFEIFEPDASNTYNLFDLIQGVTVIDLSGYDPSIQNLVVAITLDLFYSQMRSYGSSKIDGDYRQLNKMILVDEADNFLSKDFESLKKILKEGREFGVGTILSTQLLSHFSTSDNDYANYILTWVIHNVADLDNKDIRYIFNTKSKAEEDMLYNKVKRLQKHESMVKMGDSNNPILMRDRAFWELVK